MQDKMDKSYRKCKCTDDDIDRSTDYTRKHGETYHHARAKCVGLEIDIYFAVQPPST
jgi:hypothetical protein